MIVINIQNAHFIKHSSREMTALTGRRGAVDVPVSQPVNHPASGVNPQSSQGHKTTHTSL